jgi:branched-chain amino acid transport system ATP-binding protein
MTPILETIELQVEYDRGLVIRGLSMTLVRGEIVVIVGRNGAGKSTLLRTIAGLVEPKEGSIRLAGRLLDDLTIRSRVQMGISFLAQNRECFHDLTTLENINVSMSCLGLGKPERDARRHDVLTLFSDLRPLLSQTAGRLSGGQQQLLVLAMALSQRPRVLLLDEPFLGLGEAPQAVLDGALRTYVAEGGAVLLVEQKLRVASALADRMLYLENGRIEMQGTASELLKSPVLIKRYLGVPVGGNQ